MSAATNVVGATATRTHSRALRTALRSWRVQVGLVVTILIVLFALIGPLIAPHAPSALVGPPFAKPSPGLPLGTDYLGHDVWSRVLSGGRMLIWMSVAAALIGMLLGVPLGLIAAYRGGWRDEVIMRGSDVILALPVIVFAMLVVSLLGASPLLLVVVVGIAHAPQVARMTRGVAGEVVHREYVQACEALGTRRTMILLREVVPNIITPLMVEFGLRVVWSVAAIAGLSVLGVGLQPPTADWGLMINENRSGLSLNPWCVIAPAVCIALYAIGVNMLAEGSGRSVAGLDRGSE